MDVLRLKSTGDCYSIGRKIDLAAARVMASTAPRGTTACAAISKTGPTRHQPSRKAIGPGNWYQGQ